MGVRETDVWCTKSHTGSNSYRNDCNQTFTFRPINSNSHTPLFHDYDIESRLQSFFTLHFFSDCLPLFFLLSKYTTQTQTSVAKTASRRFYQTSCQMFKDSTSSSQSHSSQVRDKPQDKHPRQMGLKESWYVPGSSLFLSQTFFRVSVVVFTCLLMLVETRDLPVF